MLEDLAGGKGGGGECDAGDEAPSCAGAGGCAFWERVSVGLARACGSSFFIGLVSAPGWRVYGLCL